jgi:DNA-binding SARP family transcriptional activator
MDRASALGNGNEATARWSLRLLGGFELVALPGGERVALPGKRERVLLAYLAVSPNCRASRRKLATLLWGDATDETALDNMRTCVWGLRKALGDTEHRVIASEGDDIVLGAAAFEIDALTFRTLAAQLGKEELEEAAKLYAGEFLGELEIENDEFESWRREEAGRFKDQALDVLKRLMTQLAEAGETERAIEVGTRILRFEPLHEIAMRGLMRLYAESGPRGAAIQLYRRLSDTPDRSLCRCRALVGQTPEERDAQDLQELPARHADNASGHDQHRSPRLHQSMMFLPDVTRGFAIAKTPVAFYIDWMARKGARRPQPSARSNETKGRP